MKNSQLIALVILLVVVSVCVWVGAFSGNDKRHDKGNSNNGPSVSVNTGSTDENKPTATTPGATESPKPTEKPTQPAVDASKIKNSDFSKYNNVFDYWSVNFTQDASDDQNYPYVIESVANTIEAVEAIPSVRTKLEVGGASRYVISNATVESETEVYLTFSISFEDGHTKEILAELAKSGTKATFFVTRDYMESNKDIVSEIFKAGHVIGIKAPSDDIISSMTAEELANEIEATEKVYRGIVGEGQRMRFYRSTYFSQRSIKVAEALGYKVVFNTYSTNSSSWDNDTQGDTKKAFERLWERASYDGSVPELTSTKLVADALEMYLAEANGKITFKTLG